MLPADLVAVLVCPKSKRPLIYFPRGETDRDEADGFLLCPASRLRYPIHDGVPVMLVEEAIAVPAHAVEILLVRARELGLSLPAEPAPSVRDGSG
ncbi:MAG TPA: Trm112 family protein [Kofleriaceae bacterium]|nr:Trm112 family protein [Kofleriaceae bacterium]